jgi:hypothetical protein
MYLLQYKGGRIMENGTFNVNFEMKIAELEQWFLLEFNEEPIKGSIFEEIEKNKKDISGHKLIEIVARELRYILKRTISVGSPELGRKYKKVKISGGYLTKLEIAHLSLEGRNGLIIMLHPYGAEEKYKYTENAKQDFIDFFSNL